MIKEMEKFKEVVNGHKERYSNLDNELQQKKNEQSKEENKYRKMIKEDSAGTASYSVAELTNQKRTIAQLSEEVQTAQERIDRFNGEQKDNDIKEALNAVKDGWRREVEVINKGLSEIYSKAREHRAKTTLAVLEAHNLYAAANKLIRELNSAENQAGIAFEDNTSKSGVLNEPLIYEIIQSGGQKGFRTILDTGIIPSYDELVRVYQMGELPAWVKHYQDTGELKTEAEL